MLNMYSEEQFNIQSIKADTSGFIMKETATSQLVSAIRKIYNGCKFIS